MSLFKKTGFISLLVALLLSTSPVSAASSPGLGLADSFSILSGSYVNTAIGTTINGDLGYTTPPAVSPTVNGTTHIVDNVYNQAGIDQNSTLTALNSQPCDFTYASGAIDLGTDTTFGPAGAFSPGVYCIDGAADIGGGSTITLTGSGAYIFRMTGALTTSASSVVVLAGGASACDVWWTPAAATTLGANSTFAGTDIDASGITIGSTVTWTGRALAFGGTVSTTTDTINTIPDCASASNTDTTMPTATPTINSGSGGSLATLASTGSSTALYGAIALLAVTASGIVLVRNRK